MINGEFDKWDAEGRPVVVVSETTKKEEKLILGKRNGVFVAITCKSKIYKDYDDPKMTPEYKNSLFPLCLMMQRWDGRVGFPGGFVDLDLDGKTQEEALELLETEAWRELYEETGLEREEKAKLEFIRSDKVKDELVVHLFHFHISHELSVDDLRDAIAIAVDAKDFLSEGSPFWAHLYDEGLQTLLNANTLASCVKEELETVVERINKL